MKLKETKNLTNEELLQDFKKIKSTHTSYCVLFGMMIGIAIYSTVKNGFGFFTFLPLFFLPIVIMNGKIYKKAKEEIKSIKTN